MVGGRRKTPQATFDQLRISLITPVSVRSVSSDEGLADDLAVDPAEQKRIDDRIKAAKTQLNVIEDESSLITTDLAKHKKDESDYHTAMVGLAYSLVWNALTGCLYCRML